MEATSNLANRVTSWVGTFGWLDMDQLYQGSLAAGLEPGRKVPRDRRQKNGWRPFAPADKPAKVTPWRLEDANPAPDDLLTLFLMLEKAEEEF